MDSTAFKTDQKQEHVANDNGDDYDDDIGLIRPRPQSQQNEEGYSENFHDYHQPPESFTSGDVMPNYMQEEEPEDNTGNTTGFEVSSNFSSTPTPTSLPYPQDVDQSYQQQMMSHESYQQPSLPSVLIDHDFGFTFGPAREPLSDRTSIKPEKSSDADNADDENKSSNDFGSLQASKGADFRAQDVYCICRTSDVNRFMIGCDKCSEWFHGDCINLRKTEAKKVEECSSPNTLILIPVYLTSLTDKHPELEIKFKSQKSHHSEGLYSAKKAKRVSRMCGECIACRRTEDCVDCDFCQDMKKFGGEGRLRQKCRLRQCLKLSKILTKKSGRYTFPDEYLRQYREFMSSQQFDPEGGSSHYTGDWNQPIAAHHDDEAGEFDLKKAVRIKNAKQTQVDRQKKRKDKERKDLMKKQLRESKQEEMRRKKEERLRRRKLAVENKPKRNYHQSHLRDEFGASKRQDAKNKDEPRHCLGPGCINAAVANSKYCCDECGVQLALRRLQEILPERSKIWKEKDCVANKKGEKLIEKIHEQQEIAQRRLHELDKQHADFEAMLEKSKELTVCEEEENDESEVDIDLTVDCVSCGAPLAPRIALKHMEKCYAKLECLTSFGAIYKSAGNLFCDKQIPQQGTYCKRLRVLCPEHTKDSKIGANEVCGCPVNENEADEVTEFCRVSKRKCTKHFYWEKLRRAEIDLKRLHEWWKLEEGLEQERSIRMAMTNRGGIDIKKCPKFPAPDNGHVICDHLLGAFCAPVCSPGFTFQNTPASAYVCNPMTKSWATYPAGYPLPWPNCVNLSTTIPTARAALPIKKSQVDQTRIRRPLQPGIIPRNESLWQRMLKLTSELTKKKLKGLSKGAARSDLGNSLDFNSKNNDKLSNSENTAFPTASASSLSYPLPANDVSQAAETASQETEFNTLRQYWNDYYKNYYKSLNVNKGSDYNSPDWMQRSPWSDDPEHVEGALNRDFTGDNFNNEWKENNTRLEYQMYQNWNNYLQSFYHYPTPSNYVSPNTTEAYNLPVPNSSSDQFIDSVISNDLQSKKVPDASFSRDLYLEDRLIQLESTKRPYVNASYYMPTIRPDAGVKAADQSTSGYQPVSQGSSTPSQYPISAASNQSDVTTPQQSGRDSTDQGGRDSTNQGGRDSMIHATTPALYSHAKTTEQRQLQSSEANSSRQQEIAGQSQAYNAEVGTTNPTTKTHDARVITTASRTTSSKANITGMNSDENDSRMDTTALANATQSKADLSSSNRSGEASKNNEGVQSYLTSSFVASPESQDDYDDDYLDSLDITALVRELIKLETIRNQKKLRRRKKAEKENKQLVGNVMVGDVFKGYFKNKKLRSQRPLKKQLLNKALKLMRARAKAPPLPKFS
eukprot:gene6001-6699_t